MRAVGTGVARALAVGFAAFTSFVCSHGIAAAAPITATPFQIPLIQGAVVFAGPCSTVPCIETFIATTGTEPGVTIFTVSGEQAISTGPYWVHWHNLATGASGVATVTHAEPAVVRSGIGPVTAVATGTNALAGSGMFFAV